MNEINNIKRIINFKMWESPILAFKRFFYWLMEWFGYTNTKTIKENTVKENCMCLKCSPITFPNSRFNVCAICGNKRCPHASDHSFKCTNSNDVGQFGSVYY